MQRSKCFVTTLCLLIFLTSAGCLRYVPSRKEIQANTPSDQSVSGEQELAGPDVFKAYERDLATRLDQLLEKRSRLLTQSLDSSYRLGTGDVLEIDVFGLPELHCKAEVDYAGDLQLPLLGAVPARGASLEEFRRSLTESLRRYVKRPQPQVTIKEYGSHKVSVTGSVVKPGIYSLMRQSETLMEVLSRAGGRSDKAGTRVILLPAPNEQLNGDSQISPSATRELGVEIDIDDLIGGVNRRPLFLPLLSNDTIVVPEMGSVKVDGEVNKGGSFPLSAKTSTLGAVAAAGGLTYSANVHEVEVIRDIGAGKKAYTTIDLEQVGLNGVKDILLRDGDVVRVPSEYAKFQTRQLVEAINGIFRGGISGQVR